jgi:hypothetical protein
MDSQENLHQPCAAVAQQRQERGASPRRVERWRCWWRRPWAVAVVTALGLALAGPHVSQAKTFHCDAGDVQCLINAITTANANGEQNTIRLQAGTYTLTAVDNDENGLPVITSRLTITGEGAETTSIEREQDSAPVPFAPAFRLFMVAESGILSLERLTLRGGGGFNFFGGGGGIFNNGTLAVTQSTITENVARPGFPGCAGIDNRGTATIAHSTIASNVGLLGCGGLANAGTMVVTATTFAHNSADGESALLNRGTLTVTNSTFTDNTTAGSGKGTLVNVGTLVVSNTTFARNVIVTLWSFGPSGAAIANFNTLVLTNSTLADNVVQAPTVGSALLSISGGTTTILQNTLIARNVGSAFGPDCAGVVTSFGTNLIGDTTTCTIIRPPGVRDLTGDPGLGDFTDNGKPGNGHVPLLPTSQAIDAGNDTVCPLRDQLGQRRVNIPKVGASRCDIGAIEFPGKHDRPHDGEDDHHDDDDHHDRDHAAAAQ